MTNETKEKLVQCVNRIHYTIMDAAGSETDCQAWGYFDDAGVCIIASKTAMTLTPGKSRTGSATTCFMLTENGTRCRNFPFVDSDYILQTVPADCGPEILQ